MAMQNLQDTEELLCYEYPSIGDPVYVTKALKDPVLLKDDRVLKNLLWVEEKYLPNAQYFQCVQTDIVPWMRNKVAQWMSEVCEEQKCDEAVFSLAMNYMDRFLSVVNINKTHLQLLGTCCMLIASKIKDVRPMTAAKLIVYTDNSITAEDLLYWEFVTLVKLHWDVSVITPHDFLEQILTRLPFSKEHERDVKRHAQRFVNMCCATDFKFAIYPPSMIAAGSVTCAANRILGHEWTQQMKLVAKLQHITGIDCDHLQGCQEQIEKALAKKLRGSGEGLHRSSTAPHAMSSPDQCQNDGKPCTTPVDVLDVCLP